MRSRKVPGALRSVVLAFDPGYAALGWCAAELRRGEVFPVALGLVETRKDDEPGWSRVGGKAAGARAEEKRRLEELATAVHVLVDRFRPVAILAEGYSPVRSATVTGHMALAWAALFLEALHRGLRFADVSPQDLKAKLCGSRSASKKDVEAELGRRHGGERLRGLLEAGGVRWGAREHPFDALAVADVLGAKASEDAVALERAAARGMKPVLEGG